MTTRVTQTILADDPNRLGNCVSACAASFLELELEQVPHFIELGSDIAGDEIDQNAWWWTLVGFMAGHGLWAHELATLDDANPGEIVWVAGPSPRGVAHQVLYRDGALWHDPHPSRDGLLAITEVLAWRPRLHDHQPTAGAAAAPPEVVRQRHDEHYAGDNDTDLRAALQGWGQ